MATNSKGDIFVYTRTGHPTISIGTARPFAHGGSRLFQFDQDRKIRSRDRAGFLRIPGRAAGARRSAGQHLGGRSDVEHGHQVRSERAGATAAGQKGGIGAGSPAAGALAAGWPAPATAADAADAASGRRRSRATCFNGPPMWRGTRPAISMWPMATATPASRSSTRTASSSSPGAREGRSTASSTRCTASRIDAQGNVYVADAGNKRIQVFDGDGNFKTQIVNVGAPAAICITPGPHQYLYSSNSNPPEDIDADGEIYKMDLNGKVVGKFGKAGKLPKEFGTVNAIDCRSDNELYVGEIGNWRVQKLTLHSN